MYNQPFFIPRFGLYNIPTNAITRSTLLNTRNFGLFKGLGNIASSIKKINWSSLINNTSKTLGIVNQTIPLVRQIGPMFTNVKSMLKIASVFKDETDIKSKITNTTNNNFTKEKNNIVNKEEKTFINNDESPTFFINT